MISFSVAILAEISYFARNFTQKSDRQFRSIGREILPKNARNLTFTKSARNCPKFAPKWTKMAEILHLFFEQFFFQKNLLKIFKIIFQNPAKLLHKNAIKRGARNFRRFLAKRPIFFKNFLATLTKTTVKKGNSKKSFRKL